MGQRKHVRRFTLTWKIGSITVCTSIELKKHRWAWLRWAILSPLLAAYRPSIGYPWVPPNSLADHQYHTYDIQVCIYTYIYIYIRIYIYIHIHTYYIILSYYIIIYHHISSIYTYLFVWTNPLGCWLYLAIKSCLTSDVWWPRIWDWEVQEVHHPSWRRDMGRWLWVKMGPNHPIWGPNFG